MAGKFVIHRDECDLEPETKSAAVSLLQQQQQPQLSQLQPQQSHTHHQQPQPLQQQPDQNTAADEKFIALNQQSERHTQPLKREPLGLRHTRIESNNHPLQDKALLPEAPSTSSLTHTSSSVFEENQENDISMASLGSDFVPSILHDDESFNDRSFEVEEDGAMLDGIDYEEEVLSDDDFDYDDEEFKMELSQAFKQHDDSQLFKSTIYIDDIATYLHRLERKVDLRPLPNYMDHQTEIDSDKRAILINWLVEVSEEYDLHSETLFICISLIDRFLSKMSIPTNNFQLLGVAAMFIASKYEEIYPPQLYQLVEVTDDTYSGQQIRQMEQEILKTLNFQISLPTISYFLRQIFAFNKFPKKVYNLAEYLCYLSLTADQPFLEYYPSEIALAAVILAANELDVSGNISTELQNAYEESNSDQLHRRDLPKGIKLHNIDRRAFIVFQELPFCIEALRALQESTYKDFVSSRTSQVSASDGIFKKFSSEANNKVALLPPPRAEDLFSY